MLAFSTTTEDSEKATGRGVEATDEGHSRNVSWIRKATLSAILLAFAFLVWFILVKEKMADGEGSVGEDDLVTPPGVLAAIGFVGVDDSVTPQTLWDIEKEFPNLPIEWGVVYAHQGTEEDTHWLGYDLPEGVKNQGREFSCEGGKEYLAGEKGGSFGKCLWGYPTWNWVRRLWRLQKLHPMNISLHVNDADGVVADHGKYVTAILNTATLYKETKWVRHFIEGWRSHNSRVKSLRIQVNIQVDNKGSKIPNMIYNNADDLFNIHDQLRTGASWEHNEKEIPSWPEDGVSMDAVESVMQIAKEFGEVQFILPFKKSSPSEAFCKKLMKEATSQSLSNIQIFYDPSGGAGLASDLSTLGQNELIKHALESQAQTQWIGAAGGLDKTNVQHKLVEMSKAFPRRPFWADMQTSLRKPHRSDGSLAELKRDRKHGDFDVEAVRKIAGQVRQAIASEKFAAEQPMDIPRTQLDMHIF